MTEQQSEPTSKSDDAPTRPSSRFARFPWITTAIIIALVVSIIVPDLLFDRLRPDLPRDALAEIEEQVRDRYTSLTHVDIASVPRLESTGPELVIFDVREAVEHQASHIPGAIQVDPNISAVEFMRLYGREVADKQVLFYCSVGRRASRLAVRVERPLAAAGTRIHNLSGGIFRWFGEDQPLNNAAGEVVDYIHPYNRSVARLMPKANPETAPDFQMLP
ncbi:MAG: rhodanese-like domain-containing protein [Alphaproteobacteria bacterium]|nr:rhodanese-like domain-containing protein [Alphaproteobacteria bacterium SS10]